MGGKGKSKGGGPKVTRVKVRDEGDNGKGGEGMKGSGKFQGMYGNGRKRWG